MKFILCSFFYCSIACASGDEWHDCNKPLAGSSNELAQIFRPDTPETLQTPTTEELEPTRNTHSPTVMPYNVNIPPLEKKNEDYDDNDKNRRKNLGFLSKYPFLTSYRFIIPCVTVITYFFYRKIR
jgi:hypothetical protein